MWIMCEDDKTVKFPGPYKLKMREKDVGIKSMDIEEPRILVKIKGRDSWKSKYRHFFLVYFLASQSEKARNCYNYLAGCLASGEIVVCKRIREMGAEEILLL